MKTILLSRGLTARISDEDFPIVGSHKWHAIKNEQGFYAVRSVHRPRKMIYMHRLILGIQDQHGNTIWPYQGEHIDGYGLHNERDNLRLSTQRMNLGNSRKAGKQKSSLFKGVCWSESCNGWRATCMTIIHLGVFDSEEEAAQAYDEAARKEFGEFAHLNFPSIFIYPPRLTKHTYQNRYKH